MGAWCNLCMQNVHQCIRVPITFTVGRPSVPGPPVRPALPRAVASLATKVESSLITCKLQRLARRTGGGRRGAPVPTAQQPRGRHRAAGGQVGRRALSLRNVTLASSGEQKRPRAHVPSATAARAPSSAAAPCLRQYGSWVLHRRISRRHVGASRCGCVCVCVCVCVCHTTPQRPGTGSVPAAAVRAPLPRHVIHTCVTPTPPNSRL